MLLANGVSTFFTNGKPTNINGLRTFRNPPFLLPIFLVDLFNKIPLFSKDLITSVMSFFSVFATVSSEPLNNGKGFILNSEPLNNGKGFILILLLTRLDPASETALECFQLG